MPNIPINLTGASYVSRSLPLSAQVTRYFYPELQENNETKSSYVLQSFPGLKLFGTTDGADRGIFELNEVLYRVAGTTLYSVDSAGTHTTIGTIPGNDMCVFTAIGSNLILVTGGRVWQYDLTTLTEITDSDLETPNGAAHLNNQIIYDGDGGRFVSSDVGDATTINSLNYATAESHPDNIVRPYVFNQTLFLFGDKTTETWFNSGVGMPPFDRIEGGIIPEGLAALHSPANNDRFLYWLGDDGHVHRTSGSGVEQVSTIAISHAVENYATISDAIGFTFTFEGQNFYLLTFPNAGKTFCYQETASKGENIWFELSSGVSGGRYIGTSYAHVYRKHIIAEHRNGNLYELDIDTFDENGSVIQRTRDSAPLHGGLVGAPGKSLEMSRFELIMETGVGLISGQGSDPVVMLSFSDDGGRTFSTEMWGTVGKMGDFIYKVEWFVLGSFLSRIIRIQTSDPVHYSIHSASTDIEVGI